MTRKTKKNPTTNLLAPAVQPAVLAWTGNLSGGEESFEFFILLCGPELPWLWPHS